MPYHDFVTTGGHNTNGELTATPNQQYTFTFTSDDLHNIFALTTGNYEAEKSQFVVVPCLYDALDDVTTEFRKYSTTYGQSKPKVTYDKYGQVSGMSVRKLIETEGGEEGTEEYEAYKSGIEKRYGKFDLDSWYFYQFWFQLDFENAPYVDKWGFQVEILKDNYKSHVLMETEVEVNHNLYGTMRSGKRKVLCEFISNYKTIEKGGDCMQVRIRPYTINVLGERTDHAWTGYKDIYFNVNKDFDMNGEWDEVSINGH